MSGGELIKAQCGRERGRKEMRGTFFGGSGHWSRSAVVRRRRGGVGGVGGVAGLRPVLIGVGMKMDSPYDMKASEMIFYKPHLSLILSYGYIILSVSRPPAFRIVSVV